MQLFGLTELVEGFTVRAVESRRPRKLAYARSACMQPEIGPGGSTQRFHYYHLGEKT